MLRAGRSQDTEWLRLFRFRQPKDSSCEPSSSEFPHPRFVPVAVSGILHWRLLRDLILYFARRYELFVRDNKNKRNGTTFTTTTTTTHPAQQCGHLQDTKVVLLDS